MDGGAQIAGPGRRSGIGGFLDHLDLIVELLYPRKGRPRSDAVDKDEAFAVADPLVSQCGVFLLPSGIQDFQHARLAIDHHLLSVRIFNSRVVCFDEVIQAKLIGGSMLVIA